MAPPDVDPPLSDEPIPFGIVALFISRFLLIAAVVGQVTILGKQVFDLTDSELSLGLLGLAEFVPTALLAPIAGPIADRFDRRKVLGLAVMGEAAAAFGLYLYARTEPTSVTPIFLIVVGFGMARAFASPAIRALPVDLAPPGRVERVVAINSVVFQSGAIVGPIVAGFLFVVDEPLPYLVVALAIFTVVFVLPFVPASGVAKLETAPGTRAALVQGLEGLRFVRRTPVLLGAISLDLFAVLFGGAIALLPAIAEDRLGVGAVGLGWLRAAAGIGAALMGLAMAIRPVRRLVGRTLMMSVAVFGVATIALGFTTSYVVAFVALMILSAADAVSVFIRATLVPLATPAAMRGRVLALENVFIGASNELGAFESGVAASALGLVGGIVLGGIGTLVVVGVWWTRFPALRGIDRFADVRPKE